ncbi:hypothetical protein ENSA5_44280 [Enhygromyxa salina]|uniref:STAS/SEC14 domain-containing protein n=1 Tax=Enhygromyxa salina TaxID=215803 RepID=A0A2S9XKG2_9BACT|nr:hypothetical protein [Enhygromyxa salina]PRP93161.1 hypothetical protein ENSA5_44280 [Enhygromyxa salina]
MPVEWNIDEDARLTTVRVDGPLTLTIGRETLAALYAEPGYHSPMASLWDLRKAQLDPRPGEVQQFVEFIRTHRGARGTDQTALVVARPADFGISRMYQAYAETTLDFPVRVFLDLDEARAWLADSA